MKKILFFCLLTMLFTSCKKDKTTTTPDTIPLPSFDFSVTNLFPEGIAYDQQNSRFYVSSITQGTIGTVGSGGVYAPFINDGALTNTTGLEFDAPKRRLYVCNAPTGIGLYDVGSGQQISFTDLRHVIPGVEMFLNDVAVDQQGNAYVTNSAYPVIYQVDKNGKASVFYEDPNLTLPAGSFGFNGIEYSNQGFLLVAFSATNTIYKIPTKKAGDIAAITLDAPLNSPDGLLLSQDGKDLVVANNAKGGDGSVLTFTSGDKWASATKTSTFLTGQTFPTTLTIVGKTVFVLYSYLQKQSSGWSDYSIEAVDQTSLTGQ